MSDRSRRARTAEGSAGAWAWFVAWAIAGAVATIGFISFVLGVLLIPIGIGMALLLAAAGTPRGSALGLLSGSGASLLAVAYIQRDGPGTTCWKTATGGGCTQHLDPRPWLVVGIVLALSGLVLHTVARRQRTPESTP